MIRNEKIFKTKKWKKQEAKDWAIMGSGVAIGMVEPIVGVPIFAGGFLKYASDVAEFRDKTKKKR